MRFESEEPAPITAVAYSPTGRLLAAGSLERLFLYGLPEGRQDTQAATRRASVGPVRSLVFSRNGRYLHVGGQGGLRWFDVQSTSEPLWGPLLCSAGVAVAISADGETLAVSNVAGQFVFLHCAKYTPRNARLNARRLNLVTLAFSPDGRFLASGGEDGSLGVWDLSTGHLAASKPAHRGRLACVAFSPDGRVLASGGWDGLVRLWDVAPGSTPGRELVTFDWRHGWISAVAFSPDGMTAAVGGEGAVVVWDVDGV
jgi:WD40 repeat protein